MFSTRFILFVSGHLNQAEAEKQKKLALEFLEILKKHSRGPVRTAELGMLRERFPAPSVSNEEDNNGMVRFDQATINHAT